MKILKKIIYGLGILLSLASCEKYLDLTPQDSTYDKVFWVDGRNVSKASAGAFSLLRDALRFQRTFFVFGDFAAGNFYPGEYVLNYEGIAKSGGFKFTTAIYLEEGLWNWTRFYTIINLCNLILENTPNIPIEKFDKGEIEKNRLIGQAHFLRAYINFYMQRVWGDILLVKETYKDPLKIPPLARAPQEETLDFCIEDLKFAILNLDNTGSKSFASKGAAQALLAHIYAWKHDYINAELFSNDVINSNYRLVGINEYKDIWKGNSPETIFEISMLYVPGTSESAGDFFTVLLGNSSYPGTPGGYAWLVDKESVINDYFQDKNEDRFKLIIDSDNLLSKYDNVVRTEVSEKVIEDVPNSNLVLLRLADIYLLRAESYYKNGKEQLAMDDLNIVRRRAGLPSIIATGDNLFQEIFRERRRELIGEGCTQYDLIRMGLFSKLSEYYDIYSSSRIENQGYYWPLDMKVLLPQNRLLTQNPWWRNH